ncbi:MAG: antibiotic biosynthesis monooxygenase [Cyclobacteriaceae bacterium]
MVTRIWHGTTKVSDADTYLEFLDKIGIRDYGKTPGNLSIKVLRRLENDVCHFWTVTEWESLDHIRAFAGDDLEKARYYPEDKDFLLEFEEKVIHCETFNF